MFRKASQDSGSTRDQDGFGAGNHEVQEDDILAPLKNIHLHSRPILKHSFTSTSTSSSTSIRPDTSKGSSDPLGLQIAYQPEDATGDIVFVHGLSGSAWKTWSATDEATSFWPQWLANEDPLAMFRVSTFGYNSKVKGSATNLDIIDFAKDLLFQLITVLNIKENNAASPIIFVAHSMGGLVVKKAIMLGKHDKQYASIMSRIKGIVFLATPHRGSQYARTLNNILSLAPIGTSSKAYVTGLGIQSSALQDINESFRQYCDGLFLCSFYETLKSNIGLSKVLVVEKDSAILGYADELSTAMDANHRNICKYKNRSDPNFLKIHGVLKQWASQLHTYDSESQNLIYPQKSHPPDLPTQIKHIFGLATMADDNLEVQSKITLRSSSGNWLFAKQDFQSWYEEGSQLPSSRMLLLIGPPGTGKSVICKSTASYLKSRGGNIQYHTFNKTHQLKQTASFCLRSIAAQAALYHKEFQTAILRLHEKTGVRFNQNHSFQSIWDRVFEDILFKLQSSTPLFWVLDSIDESDSTAVILQRLSSIQSKTPIKVFATCRPIKGIPTSAETRLATYFLQPSDTEADMLEFVTRTIRDTLPNDSATEKFVQDEIMSKAEGSFLWTRLALEMLQDNWHTKDDIKAALTRVPSGMTAMYSRMVTLMEDQGSRNSHLARHVLAWVVCSWRPLYINELEEALKPAFGTFTNLALTITQICGHFITIDRSDERGPRACLIHITAKEFLTKENEAGAPWINSKRAHQDIARTCLSYLCDDKWRGQLGSLGGLSGTSRFASSGKHTNRLLAISTTYPLLPYATWHWAYHLKKSPTEEFELLEIIETFMISHSLSWIEAIAFSGNMIHLVRSARYLKAYVKKTSKSSCNNTKWIQSWATDFIRIASKFATNLIMSPSSVYRNIPPMCPTQSMVARAFGPRRLGSLSVTGSPMQTWDDCLASIIIDNDEQPSQVLANDIHFFTLVSSLGEITVWNAETCEKLHVLKHDEFVALIAIGNSGALLVASSLSKFYIWDTASARILHEIPKTADARVHDLVIGPGETEILAAFENFVIETIHVESGKSSQQHLDVSRLDVGYQNCPWCQSISPDGTKVAMGWRGRPPLVWDLRNGHGAVPLKCRSRAVSDSAMYPKDLVWHPDSGSLVVLCQDTTVYEWRIFDDELIEFSHIKAHQVTFSPDGSLFLSSDHEGTLSIWTLPRLGLIYSLKNSGDPLSTVVFSPDNQRFYDIRGSNCNIWEPDALIRSDDPDLEETGSLSGSIATEAVISTQQSTSSHITVLVVGPTDKVFACGREDGSVVIHDALYGGRLRKVYNHTGSNDVTLLAWSSQGKFIASCDLSSLIIVKRLQQKDNGKWAVFPVMEHRLEGAVDQLLFSSDENFLLITTSTKIRVWDMKAKVEKYAVPSISHDRRYWVPGSIRRDLFGLGENDVQLLDWATGLQARDENDGFAGANNPDLSSLHDSVKRTEHSAQSGQNTIIWSSSVNAGSHHVVATVQEQDHHWTSAYRHLQLTVRNLSTKPELSQKISPLICNKIKQLLGTIENNLLFLSFDGWICSYNIAPLILAGNHRRLSTGVMSRKEDLEGFRRHFYIPRDWLNTASADAVANADGTIFFPKQGEVAIVRNGLRF